MFYNIKSANTEYQIKNKPFKFKTYDKVIAQ